MRFSDAHFDLAPTRPFAHAPALLREFDLLGFEPAACHARLVERIGAGALDPAWFDLEALAAGGRVASEMLLYAGCGPDASWSWRMRSRARPGFALTLEPDAVDVAAAVVREGGARADSETFRAECVERLGEVLTARLWPDGLVSEAPTARGTWARVERPGIYRREHASLVFRSRTTTLVLDPQSHQHDWTTLDGALPAEPARLAADGVLVTHAHTDHWHLPSVLRVVRDADAPVIVPHVPRASVLCPERPADSLALAGQRALAPAWWSTVRVGDFEVDVLPFYGEQPLRHGDDLGDVRNWGNCYRVTCPEFSALVLVDSGADPAGDVVDVVARSARERGPVDVLLSCCMEFSEGFNFGLPEYFLAVPMETLHAMASDPARRGAITLGPAGVARACRAARARRFLPYAHGFNGLGMPAGFRGVGEARALEAIATDLRGHATEVLAWSPGDVALAAAGGLVVARGAGATAAPDASLAARAAD